MSAKVLRLVDANANRARKALRVVEDYARFILNDDDLCDQLKSLRHELTDAIKPWLAVAILHRDVIGDVGTTHTTDGEQHRADLADVVTAAGKRFGEAVRTLEEYAKTIDPAAAGRLEKLRYQFYDIEQAVARTLRPALFDRVRLYVLITGSACRRDWFETAKAAIAGGADALQLREKEMDGGELLTRARRLVALCKDNGVLSIINDRADVAALADADGVHVGQTDLPVIEARKIVGPGKIVGVSTHQMSHAKQAVLDGADYIGVGPVYRSPTKPRDISPGLPYAREVAGTIGIPAVAIAGITADNLGEVLGTGMTAVAVTAAVTGADDVAAAARRLREILTARPVHHGPSRARSVPAE